MEIIEVKERTNNLINQSVNIWEDSVNATHTFLSKVEIKNIKQYVPKLLQEVPHLIVVKSGNELMAFMGVNNQKIEMLFVKSKMRNQGIGKSLINYGINNFQINEVTVNEDNNQAVSFYEHLGFKVFKRTNLDEQGNPYPILYMKINKKLKKEKIMKPYITYFMMSSVLNEIFNIKRLGIVGGGNINGAFLDNHLLDEVSVLVDPGIDGRGGMTSTFDGIKMDRTPFKLNLKNVTKYDDGAILLEYSLINK
ncbi:MAG: GNAT family N-acetyltransferase [Acholeplasmatales bacterium]|nr:GNAT family N-acetyltransferase [Acholeplasmatales bacterium]